MSKRSVRKRRRRDEKRRRRNEETNDVEDKRKKKEEKLNESRHGMSVQESEKRSERNVRRNLIKSARNVTAQENVIMIVNDQLPAQAEESPLLKRRKTLKRRTWKRLLLKCSSAKASGWQRNLSPRLMILKKVSWKIDDANETDRKTIDEGADHAVGRL